MKARAFFLIRMYLPNKGLWLRDGNDKDWFVYVSVLNAIRYMASEDTELWGILTHLIELSNRTVSIEGDCG